MTFDSRSEGLNTQVLGSPKKNWISEHVAAHVEPHQGTRSTQPSIGTSSRCPLSPFRRVSPPTPASGPRPRYASTHDSAAAADCALNTFRFQGFGSVRCSACANPQVPSASLRHIHAHMLTLRINIHTTNRRPPRALLPPPAWAAAPPSASRRTKRLRRKPPWS